jgi:hypothetical protein
MESDKKMDLLGVFFVAIFCWLATKKIGRFLTLSLVYISTNFAKKEKIRQTFKTTRLRKKTMIRIT